MSFQDPADRPLDATKRVCLGKITGAHGIKGLVKILPYGDDPSLIETLSPVFTSVDGDKTLTVTLKNSQGRTYLAEIPGVHDRNASEALSGTELYVPFEALPEIDDDGSYYYDDLLGLAVQDESGAAIGHVLAVHNFGAGDLLDIKPETGGESFLLPFTDAHVPKVSDVIIIRDYKAFMA